jgi:prefoldin subunit 5
MSYKATSSSETFTIPPHNFQLLCESLTETINTLKAQIAGMQNEINKKNKTIKSLTRIINDEDSDEE